MWQKLINNFMLIKRENEIATIEQDLDELQAAIAQAMHAQEVALNMLNKGEEYHSPLINKEHLTALYIKNTNFIEELQKTYLELLITLTNMTGNKPV